MKKLIVFAIVFFVSSSLHAQQARQMISYQGMVQGVNGAPVRDSIYPIAVSFWTDATGGNRLWRDVFQTTVTGGVFNIQLGSGNPLPSPQDMDRPLWISISFNGGEEALPRSPLSAVPTALNVADSSITTAKLADRSVTWNKMGTDYVPYIRVNGAKVNTGQNSINFTGGNGLRVDYDSNSMSVIIHSDSGGADANKGGNNKTLNANGTIYWGETGNYLVDPATGHFLGTTGDTAFEIHVNNGGDTNEGYGRVMRFEPNDSSADIIAGWNAGSVGGNHDAFGSYGAVIAGGGSHGHANVITSATFSTIGGGDSNNIYSGDGGTIAGGEDGAVSGYNATVGGGINNSAGSGDGSQRHQTVGGGNDNTASGDDAAIAGGESNIANGDHSEVSGGFDNTSSGTGSAVGGGEHNTASGNHAAIVAGENNTASGSFSSILGGQHLTLGDSSVGFNGSTSGTATNLSGFPSIAYLGNVNLWLGNVDNNAAALRFYEPNLSYTYSSGAHYSSFQADTQTSNIIYTLPSHVPTAGQFLKAATVTGSTNVGLSWDAVSGSGGGSAGWLLTGNAGTSPGTNYLGTNDDSAFEIHVDNSGDSGGGKQRVMRYEPGVISPDILGGSSTNTIGSGLSGTAVLSGGSAAHPNRDSAVFSVVAGGEGNAIDALSEYCDIGGGRYNAIASSFESTILGGYGNLMISSNGVIGSGFNNTIENGMSDGILGGDSNSIIGYSFTPYNSFIGGGYGNRITDANYATLGGGESNTINFSADFSFLGSGEGNSIQYASDHSVLGGGESNKIDVNSDHSVLGGGQYDTVQSSFSVVTGGQGNVITPSADGLSTISGGGNNRINTDGATIGGGYANTVDTPGSLTTISGGYYNYALGAASTIGGGDSNWINSDQSTIGGGSHHYIAREGCTCGSVIAGGHRDTINALDHRWLDSLPPTYSSPYGCAIAGGESNTANGIYAAVGGGAYNHAIGFESSIPGGRDLVALDNQTVIGMYNANVPYNQGLLGSRATNMSIFIVGNGTSDTTRANAFEVTFPGASIVHDMDSSNDATFGFSTEPRFPVYGGRYQDNTIVAQGDVTALSPLGLIPSPKTVPTKSDFGVYEIFHPHVGEFIVCIKNVDTHGDTVQFTNGTVTATLKDTDANVNDSTIMFGCGTIAVSAISPSGTLPAPFNTVALPGHFSAWFIVRTSGNTGCEAFDRAFYFRVCARPF